MVLRHLGALAGVTVWLLGAAGARAEQPPLALEWTAPEGCPGRADVLARVLALVSKDGRSEDTRAAFRGVVARSGDQAFLRLETSVTRAGRSGATGSPDALSGTRQLAGATCDEVTAAGVLVIALAIDPDAAEEAASSAAAPGSNSAPEPAPAEPRPAVPVTPPAAVEPAPPAGSGVAPPEKASGTHVFAVGNVLLDVGTLPGPALGFRAGAGLTHARARVELGAFYLLPRFAPADESSSSGAGAGVSLFAGNVLGCYALLPTGVRLDGCLGAQFGALIADGEGFDRSTTAASPWLAVEAATALTFPLTRDLSLGASVGAVIPLGRSTVRFAKSGEDPRTYEELHRPSPVSLRLGLGLSYLFR